MIALRIEFRSGTLHAPPWSSGDRVDIEWPPAPIRLTEALLHAWRREPTIDHLELATLVASLSRPPVYLLPCAMSARSRHRDVVDTTTPGVIDSLLAIDGGAQTCAYAFWPEADLKPDLQVVADRLCDRIEHLGNEACVSVSRVDQLPGGADWYVCAPAAGGDENLATAFRRSLVSLSGPMLASMLADTRNNTRGLPTHLPTMNVNYVLALSDVMVKEQRDAETFEPLIPPLTLRFGLREKRHALPSVLETLSVAEAMRGAVLSTYSRLHGKPVTRRLAGKGPNGQARDGHDHPYFLPKSLNGSTVDVVDIYLPGGCTHDEYIALTSVRAIFDGTALRANYALELIGEMRRPIARRWRSVTPIVLDRFPKTRGSAAVLGVDSPANQVTNALTKRGTRPARVEANLEQSSFRNRRTTSDPHRPLAMATIDFEYDYTGPLVLGRLAHFGLGRFEPVEAYK